MSSSCVYKYHCYPHVLHHNELPDKNVLAKAVAEHEAKRNNTSSTSQLPDQVAYNNSSSTGGTAPSEQAAIEGNDTQPLQPCAGCHQLVNGDCKCEKCNQNMHVFCSAFPTTDGEGTIMCLNCTFVNESDADDNAGTDTAVAKSTRGKRSKEKGMLIFFLMYCYYFVIYFFSHLFFIAYFAMKLPVLLL